MAVTMPCQFPMVMVGMHPVGLELCMLLMAESTLDPEPDPLQVTGTFWSGTQVITNSGVTINYVSIQLLPSTGCKCRT